MSEPQALPIEPVTRPFDAVIRPPGSKSLTNRALLLAALAHGTSTIRHALVEADDARRMLEAIVRLGARVETRGDVLVVSGVGGQWRTGGEPVTLDLGNAGTATRFLAAAAMLAPRESGGIIIDGNARMRQRPIGELAAALHAVGVQTRSLGAEGYPPLHVLPADPGALKGEVSFSRTASSQFVSALLLVAPWLPHGLTVRFTEPPTSASYIDMTIALLRRCGAQAKSGDLSHPSAVTVFPTSTPSASGAQHGLRGFTYEVEPDASGAAPFWAAAALVPGARVLVPGLWLEGGAGPCSLQGDARFVRVLHRMGAQVELAPGGIAVRGDRLLGIDVDLSQMPDTAMALATIMCFADGPSRVTGLRTLRVKETDRILALVKELTKIGARIEPFAGSGDEGLAITPIPAAQRGDATPVHFDTYDDHRMAMALALVGLRRRGVRIRDPDCVAKTYPEFWRDFAHLR
jgi:3-phosphoshikimate 1-carboxyvinyltransferase